MVMCNEAFQSSDAPDSLCPPAAKRLRVDDLLSFEASSDSNGSSPIHGPGSTVVEKEVTKFQADDSMDSHDPLLWWKSNESRYQTVARLAKQILCIQPTSVPAERLFSAAGSIVTRKRASLHPKMWTLCCFYT